MVIGLRNKHLEDLYQKARDLEYSQEEETKSQIHTEDEVSANLVSDYVKNQSNLDKNSNESEHSNAAERLSLTLEIISTCLSNDITFVGPKNFIYFNGYNSGISTFSKKSFDKNPLSKVSTFKWS